MRPWRPGGAARHALGLDPARPTLGEPGREALSKSEMSLEGAHLAWELVRLAGRGTEAELDLVLLLQDALSRGSTRLSLTDGSVATRARTLLGADDVRAAAATELARAVHADPSAGAPLFGPRDAVAPLLVDGAHLYAHRVLAAEARLCERLRERLARSPVAEVDASVEVDTDAAIAGLVARPGAGVTLTAAQRHAVRRGVTEPLCVIGGGPGTGKTSVVVAILRAAAALGLAPESIALAAPTGKAADRARVAIERGLSSVADPSDTDRALATGLSSPRTLHRLLGYSPRRGGFRHHALNPLSERLVIVDESSMIDLFLMDSLLAALSDHARLVLLGDAEQLPSVAAGAVFRDLLAANAVPAVTLTESHRMDPSRPEGFNILSVARAMNEGRRERLCEVSGGPANDPSDDPAGDSASGPADDPPDQAAAGTLRPEAPDRIARLPTLPRVALMPELALGGAFLHDGPVEDFLRWWSARTHPPSPGPVRLDDPEHTPKIDACFDALDRARLLSVTRRAGRPTGVESVNAYLHGAGPWRAGEPVLVHRNDYARGLFNGDQGVLLDVVGERGRRLSAVFRRGHGYAAHPLDAVAGVIELGYATTVHKAQGSEHDVVALLLPDTDSPRLLTREVVYTAITRARRAVILVGSVALLDRAAARAVVRSTGVTARLEMEAPAAVLYEAT